MKLIAVTDDQMTSDQLVKKVCTIAPFIDAVILREKSKTDEQVIHLIQTLLESGIDQSKIIVHGRADIATCCDIHKVQLPGHGIPIKLAKEHFPTLSFGRSIHSFAEAKTAVMDGADWLLYGHLFETGSKDGLPPRGTDELAHIIQSLDVPIYAIGGIQPTHIAQLAKINVTGIAVMSSIFKSETPALAAKSYKE